MRCGLALFIVIGKAPYAELAANLVKTMRKVIAFRDKHRPPFIAKIYRPDPTARPGSVGRVEMSLSLDEWRALQRRGKH
jgi:hypothetical protein